MYRALLLLAFVGVTLTIASAQDDAVRPVEVSIPESPGKMVTIEITLVKLDPETLAEGDDLAVSLDLPAALKDWEAKGTLRGVDHIRFATLERQKGWVQYGARKPTVTSSQYAERTKQLVHGYQIEDIGFLVTAIPAIESDGAIVLALDVQRSDFEPTPPPKVTPIDGNVPVVANEPPPTTILTQSRHPCACATRPW
ncbi:MAG: hypothetical protein SGJ19_26645 [Planctomycetia bacterium]|nr:hypothetical protein [Planctomycetia bacterium]